MDYIFRGTIFIKIRNYFPVVRINHMWFGGGGNLRVCITLCDNTEQIPKICISPALELNLRLCMNTLLMLLNI